MKTYEDMAEEILRDKGYYDKGWRVVNDAVLTCPHGHRIEYDGSCFEGCESPFLQLGIL